MVKNISNLDLENLRANSPIQKLYMYLLSCPEKFEEK